MSPSNASKVSLHNCLYCDGSWVSKDALKQLLVMEYGSQQPSRDRELSLSFEAAESPLGCPSGCDDRLRTTHMEGIELDLCPCCNGIFFDRGELKAILPTKYEFTNPIQKEAFIVEAIFWLLFGINVF